MNALHTIAAETSACPVCASNLKERWSRKDWLMPQGGRAYHLDECQRCQTLFCSPRPGIEILKKNYQENYNYRWFEEHLLFKRMQGWHRWLRLKHRLRQMGFVGNRLLEIGCGHGFFLEWVVKDGWQAVGVDYPGSGLVYAGKTSGAQILEAADMEALQADGLEGDFDCVVLWHSLEHTPNPGKLLQAAKRYLRPGGYLLLAVPNLDCSGMQRIREEWTWCQEAYVHLTHFSPRSLVKITTDTGYRVVQSWTRDAWDANRWYDTYVKPKLFKSLWKLRRHRRLYFFCDEGLRLMGYVLSMFLPLSEGKGCELLQLAQKR